MSDSEGNTQVDQPTPPVQVGSRTGQVKAFNAKKGYGFISVHDLETAFRRQGRQASHAEVVSWVRRKDLSNIGAVCLEDFLQSYGK